MEIDKKILQRYIAGFASRSPIDLPPQIDRWSDDYTFHACPCGGIDHYAMRAKATRFSPPGYVLNCFITNQIWMIKQPDILSIIEQEEVKFLSLLKKWEGKLPEHCDALAALKLITEQGVPREMVETRCADASALDVLLEEHRLKSGNSFRKEIFNDKKRQRKTGV